MSKPAETINSDSHDLLPDEGVDGDKLFLRQLKEEEIRAKLEEFARELAQVQAERSTLICRALALFSGQQAGYIPDSSVSWC